MVCDNTRQTVSDLGLADSRSHKGIRVRGLIVKLRTGNPSRYTVLVSSATTSIADMIGRIDEVRAVDDDLKGPGPVLVRDSGRGAVRPR